MPRPGPRRPLVNVRLAETGIAALDAFAAELGVTRSDVIRALLARGMTDERVLRNVRADLKRKTPDP